jgi:hypothetical protein
MTPVTTTKARDVDIRRSLRAQMDEEHALEPDTLVVDELGLCQGLARIDLAVINGSLHGYEIKSEVDTLRRLGGQLEVYSRALDFVTVVTSPNHVKGVRASVPKWWGIWTARKAPDGTVTLHIARQAKQNDSPDPDAISQLLWRDEVLAELEARGLVDGYRTKSRRVLWARLASALDIVQLRQVVRDRLKLRQRWRASAPPASSGDWSRPSAT